MRNTRAMMAVAGVSLLTLVSVACEGEIVDPQERQSSGSPVVSALEWGRGGQGCEGMGEAQCLSAAACIADYEDLCAPSNPGTGCPTFVICTQGTPDPARPRRFLSIH